MQPTVSSPRTLTVHCQTGLCNRLKVLISGLAIAEASERRFTMIWPRSSECGATYDELFANPWPVEYVPREAAPQLPFLNSGDATWPDLLTAHAPELGYSSHNWLLRPKQFPEHARLWPRVAELLASLTPVPAVQARIDAIRQTFRPIMIGVHARRGDFLRTLPAVVGNTSLLFAAVDKRLVEQPDAGIFLASDDGAPDIVTGRQSLEGLCSQFRARYGDRVIWSEPRTLDRRNALSIQDALVDLWLLRQTDTFVGTKASSFSEMAYFGRDIPHELCAAPARWYAWVQRTSPRHGCLRAT